jgi:asparagine synthase (glutamine-hydrolysing)
MCGIAGILRVGAAADPPRGTEAVIASMMRAMRHRGPDDKGTYVSGPVGLGFRRLSILDTSMLGHQPMLSEDGQVALIFNGEIYNYVELRSELLRRGHSFTSSGDTEVLLRAYLEWGTKCVERFNGMWAFVLYDARSKKIFGSRDRFGIKPLYRFRGNGFAAYSSEIKAIRASGLYDDATNWPVAARYLLNGELDDSLQTFYSGIEQIAPATAFEETSDGTFRQWTFWTLDTNPEPYQGNPAVEFADLFEDAVRLHMRSDVPVGVHLSGGLDSTSIICASSRIRKAERASGPLMAFSYVAPEFDETRYIHDTVAQTGATLVELASNPVRLWELLGEVLRFQDEPMHTMTPLVGYELMRLSASHGIKVILNGQGADETIGGYGSYFSDYWCTLMRSARLLEAWREIGRYVGANGGAQMSLFVRQWRRLSSHLLGAFDAYRALARWRRRSMPRDDTWYSPALIQQAAQQAPVRVPADLNAQLAYSIRVDPLPLYLRIEDRNSMAHSVEARLPFLDYRLVSLLFRLAPEWRLRGPWNKFVLREGMRGRIPESVRTRVDKMGFPVPSRAWFIDALHGPALDLLHSAATRDRGIYDVRRVVADLGRHKSGEIDISARLVRLAQFELWTRL